MQFLNTLEDDTSGFRKVIQKLDKIQNTKPEQLESSADLEKIQYRLSP